MQMHTIHLYNTHTVFFPLIIFINSAYLLMLVSFFLYLSLLRWLNWYSLFWALASFGTWILYIVYSNEKLHRIRMEHKKSPSKSIVRIAWEPWTVIFPSLWRDQKTYRVQRKKIQFRKKNGAIGKLFSICSLKILNVTTYNFEIN